MTIEEWKEKVKKLNDHINSLEDWNEYAQDCQNEYDWLLKQKPKE